MSFRFKNAALNKLLARFEAAGSSEVLWRALVDGVRTDFGASHCMYGLFSQGFAGHERYIYHSTASGQLLRTAGRQDYFAIDPIRMHAMKSVQPIFYGAEFKETLVDANQAYKTTVEEAANIGWRSGVAFPFRGGFEGEIAGASFGFNLDREKFLDYFDAHGEALNVIGARFHFEFVIRVSREERQRFNLTERQKSVLALSAEGLAQKAIADRLQISSRTVEGHLRNIRKILECASLEAAIARASWFHLLDPPAPKPL